MGRLRSSPDIRRRKPTRREKRRLLVVSEGTKTEPGYLRGLLRLLRATAVDVRIVDVRPAGVTHPMGVIREAFKVTQAARDPYDEVWCLVDVDDHESLSEACALATTNGVRVAVSNPAFEIWVLWHYKDQRAAKTRQHLKSALKRFGHEGKNIPSSFPFEAYEDAVRRSFDCAPELLSNQVGNNPSSSFSLIIKAILGA